MFCKQCGNKLPEGASFCGKCGAAQSAAPAPRKDASDRYETKVIQVHPDWEDAAIKKFELFGWVCAHSQTVKTKDSHLEQGFGDSIVSVTETETFVKLTFKRRLNMPNYNRLKELEEEYDAANDLDDPPKFRIWPTFVGVFMIIAAAIMAFNTIQFGILGLLPALFWGIIGVVIVLHRKKKEKEHESKEAEWQKAHDEAEMIKYNCQEEARKLL